LTPEPAGIAGRVAAAPRIGIVAGEPSGDLLGSLLVGALKAIIPGASFSGIAGPRMQAAGVEAIYPMEKLAVRGYVEAVRHLPEILGIRRHLARHWLGSPPDLFVGVDAPDFNLGLEEALKAHGIPTAHLASPSIWAWRARRVTRIRRAVSLMLALFPFEPLIYERAGVPVAFVGHPLADLLPEKPDRRAMREQLRLPRAARVFALLPGSRLSELRLMADLFVRTALAIAARTEQAVFLVPLVSREARAIFDDALGRHEARGLEIQLLFGHAHDAMIAADGVLVASGTATLEAALLGRPMVITYRVPPLTARLMWPRRLLPYVGLPNVLAGEFIVPELLQEDATPDNLAQALLNLVADEPVQRRLAERFAAMRESLKRDSAASAARAILPLLAPGVRA